MCTSSGFFLLYDEKCIIWTPSWQPANCQHARVRPSKTKTATRLTHEQAQSRSDRPGPLQQNFPADLLTRERSLKVYYLKSLGVKVVCHEAIANCYSPCLLYLICLATLVLIILCFSYALVQCWLLHSSAKAKPLPGPPPPPSGVLLHPGDSSSLETPVRPRLCQAAPRAPSPHAFQPPAACCWRPLSTPVSQHSSWVKITHLLSLPFLLQCEFCEESLILYLLFQQTVQFFSSSC